MRDSQDAPWQREEDGSLLFVIYFIAHKMPRRSATTRMGPMPLSDFEDDVEGLDGPPGTTVEASMPFAS